MTSPSSVWVLRASVLYFAVSVASLIWPIYPWLGNHIEPRVLGLPWSLLWVLIVIASNFAVLVVLYRGRFIDERADGEVEP